MTDALNDTVWVEQDGNAEATSGSVATLDDPSDNTIVDPTGDTIVDTGVVLTPTADTEWALDSNS